MPTLDESVRPLAYRAHSSVNFTRFEFAGQISFESVIPLADGDSAVDDTVDTTCNAISGLDVVYHGRDGDLKEVTWSSRGRTSRRFVHGYEAESRCGAEVAVAIAQLV